MLLDYGTVDLAMYITNDEDSAILFDYFATEENDYEPKLVNVNNELAIKGYCSTSVDEEDLPLSLQTQEIEQKIWAWLGDPMQLDN